METEFIQVLMDLLARFGSRILGSAAILAIGLFLAKRVGGLSRKASEKWNLDETGVRFVGNIVYYLLAAVVALIAINNLGVEISAILAALGAAGLAVGLALTGALTNLAAGLIIAVLRPFSIGDHILTGDAEGEVVDIDVFNTTLVSFDNETIVLPNSGILEGQITNYSSREFVRVEIPLSVSVETDLEMVARQMAEVSLSCNRVLQEPPPEVQIVRFGEGSVEIQLEVSVAPVDREDVIFDVNRALINSYSQRGWAPRRLLKVDQV